jgi:hypothetical protein
MTTSYFYGLNDAMLIPGRNYAWQVQAVNLSGRDLFNNDGKSEVQFFQYGEECLPITNLGAEAMGTDRIRITWRGEWNHNRYVAQIRKTGNEQWFNYGTNLETQVIYDLEADTEYQIRVLPSCGAINGSAENTLTLKTLEQELADFDCGAEPDLPEIENQEPVDQLQIGDRITAAGFTVILTELNQSGVTYTGRGLIEVPLFNSARVEAELQGIIVNTDHQLIDGHVESIYNPNGPFIIGLDQEAELSEEGTGDQVEGEEDSFDELPETDIDIEGEIENVILDEDTGVITVIDSGGNETDIDPETADENEDGDIVIEDDAGNVWVVDDEGEVISSNDTNEISNNENNSGNTPTVGDYKIIVDNQSYDHNSKIYLDRIDNLELSIDIPDSVNVEWYFFDEDGNDYSTWISDDILTGKIVDVPTENIYYYIKIRAIYGNEYTDLNMNIFDGIFFDISKNSLNFNVEDSTELVIQNTKIEEKEEIDIQIITNESDTLFYRMDEEMFWFNFNNDEFYSIGDYEIKLRYLFQDELIYTNEIELKIESEIQNVSIVTTIMEETDDYTLSSFSINNGELSGYFLERGSGTDQEENSRGSLKRIPRGEYDIVFPHGNYHPTTARQSTKHIDSRLIVEQTAGTRSGILIHTGELVYHSTGCLLIGDCYETHEMSTDYINHSRPETISKETYLRKLDSLGSQT